jgi:hypothetical protein
MTRLLRAWAAMSREQRIAAAAALALLVTMFLPWYSLQSLNRKTGAIYTHDISAFGDVSFVEAAIFLVAVGIMATLFFRAEGRDFQLPGGDGTIVAIAGAWATLLIFYRVFSRPSGDGYPVGIQWGFFLAFVAAGSLAYAGWRMRHGERPEPPAMRRRSRAPQRPPEEPAPVEEPHGEDPLASTQTHAHDEARAVARPAVGPATPVPAVPQPRPDPAPPVDPSEQRTVLVPGSPSRRRGGRERPRFPPAPPGQLSFEEEQGPPGE